ncbi:hypothetical protein ACFL6D_03695 [Spirochaetota bacterium]
MKNLIVIYMIICTAAVYCQTNEIEVKEKRDRHFKAFVRNCSLTGGGLALMTTGLIVGNLQNGRGIDTYDEYMSAYLTITAGELRKEYQDTFDKADFWFGVAETGLGVSIVFAILGSIEFYNYYKFKKLFEKKMTESSMLIIPGFYAHDTGAGLQFCFIY